MFEGKNTVLMFFTQAFVLFYCFCISRFRFAVMYPEWPVLGKLSRFSGCLLLDPLMPN